MKELLIIGNWKMNKTFNESMEFFVDFNKAYKSAMKNSDKKQIISNNTFGVAVPFTSLSAHMAMNKVSELALCAQDMSQFNDGAFTGDISANMLNELNVNFVILGHSERRQGHKETNDVVNAKVKQALEYGIVPIVCVGETLEEYENGKSKEVVKEQIEGSLKDIDLSKVVIAYEPIWAIGTGKVATPEIAGDMCQYIHELTTKETIVQYGGSVKPDNIEELAQQEGINGFLVGGASLTVDSFVKLISLNK
ncbi:triose-phosphate isomerase [Mycoplasmopsis lipofaciens]|uniref:triose-phosphate isomerase n=1 Tax=Mycoplasmopsis lipofaciens TaxID=114884 RepID=UPI000484E762|nr:triose-phosphate isomerase [Mycoplasmopsis lipofaciens]